MSYSRNRRGLFASVLLIFTFSLSALAAPKASFSFASQEGPKYVPGELLVKYKETARRSRLTVNAMYNTAGVKRVERLMGPVGDGFERLVLWDKVPMKTAIARLQRDPNIEYVQPNYLVYALNKGKKKHTRDDEDPGAGFPCIPGFDFPGCDPNTPLPCFIPGLPFPPGCSDDDNPPPPPPENGRPPVKEPPAEGKPAPDKDLDMAYGIEKIGAVEAWKTFKGSKDFVVAVIDTGIDYNHEDLSLNVWRNPKPGPKNDLVGYDFVHDDGLPYDDQAHGTHCSGTIGAVGSNGIAISGVNQRVSIMALKFLNKDGSGSLTDAVKAIDYAVAHGVKVMSNSWGCDGCDVQAIKDAIVRAGEKGSLFVVAAGNGGQDGVGDDNDTSAKKGYPAAYALENMIGVAATDSRDELASFSNYGKKTTHVAAPGVEVYSTLPGNKYKKYSGTSMATPHVAGAAAFIWAKHPKWTYKQVKQALIDTVDKIPALASKTVSGGRINVLKAMNVKSSDLSR